MLEFIAGPSARKAIEQEGLTPSLFSSFLGASGGPKWFTLFGLDKYLFGEFFKGRQQPMHLMGSSAGAFRTACFCRNDPVSAISQLADTYSKTVYESAKPTPQEITDSGHELLNSLLGPNQQGVQEIINNPVFKAHFVVAKCYGAVASERPSVQMAGLVRSIAMNAVSRRRLARQYERFIFEAASSQLQFTDPANFTTQRVTLTEQNLHSALMASGCIPYVMAGIKDIPGAPQGMYRDGGIIDYHFDLKLHQPGLTLYPHFNRVVRPGWFDKQIKRQVHIDNYDDVLIVCPSAEFIAKLPYQKIPDRKDFTELDDASRLTYWQTVLSESHRLADAFAEFVEKPKMDQIKPMTVILN